MSKEEVTERLRKIGKILLLVGIIAGLLILAPAIKDWFVTLFYKSMQSDIQVTPTAIEEWARPDAIEVFSAELLECGFQTIGDFTINLSSRVKIRAFMHQEKNIFAMVYDKYGKPALVDFYTFYEDGSSLHFTTETNPFKSRPPEKKVWYVEEPMSIRQLFEKMVQERPVGTVRPVSKEGFAPALEQYLEEISLWESREFMQ